MHLSVMTKPTLLIRLGKFEEAIQVIDSLEESINERFSLVRLKGVALLCQNENKEALKLIAGIFLGVGEVLGDSNKFFNLGLTNRLKHFVAMLRVLSEQKGQEAYRDQFLFPSLMEVFDSSSGKSDARFYFIRDLGLLHKETIKIPEHLYITLKERK